MSDTGLMPTDDLISGDVGNIGTAANPLAYILLVYTNNEKGAYGYTYADAYASASGSTLNWGFPDNASANTWTQMAIPEPTSGLLLLIGGALLALRRKRA